MTNGKRRERERCAKRSERRETRNVHHCRHESEEGERPESDSLSIGASADVQRDAAFPRDPNPGREDHQVPDLGRSQGTRHIERDEDAEKVTQTLISVNQSARSEI